MGLSVSFGEFIGLVCALIWALNGLILRTQSYKIPPALMNAIRCGVASVLFWILLPFESSPLSFLQVPLREWALLIGSVIVGIVIGDTLYLSAIKELGVSRPLALVGTYPLTTLLFEQLLLRHPVSRMFVLGSCLVVVGVICLSFRSRGEGSTFEGRPVRVRLGVFLSLSASLLWGLSTVMLQPAIVHLTAIQANSIRMPLVALMLYLTRYWTGPVVSLRQVDRRSLLIVAGTGILGMGLGSFLFLMAIDLVGPAKTATLSSASPIFGMTMAVIFLKEELTFRVVLGVALCMAGVWLVL